LLEPEFERLTIRIGTKAGAYWPHRFVDDKDAEETLRLFDDIVAAGRHLAIMGHYSHPVELATEASEKAVRNILNTGAVIRCQAPLIRHVNDDSKIWADMIRRQVKLGCIPYYMFVERDTGAKRYFELPLERALEVYNGAFRDVSGLGRTMRGPSMSATPGKVQVLDIMDVNGEKVFALRMLQGRNADWTNRIFFAAYDPAAVWWDDLKPAPFDDGFFFDAELNEMHLAAMTAAEGPVPVNIGRKEPAGA
ncbi:MAG: lysine 2,3-aminomutase, partial [Acidimicrobiia bacterium]|nr:lysine 2,3-aminomutase [Acidimicrobiia bacterium]